MQARFTDKIVITTGSSRGMGRACALAFAREGAKVAAVDLSSQTLAQLKNDIEKELIKYKDWEKTKSFAKETFITPFTQVKEKGVLKALYIDPTKRVISYAEKGTGKGVSYVGTKVITPALNVARKNNSSFI